VLYPIAQRGQCLCDRGGQTDRLEHQASEFRQDAAVRIGSVVNLVADLLADQHPRPRQMRHLALYGGGREPGLSHDLA